MTLPAITLAQRVSDKLARWVRAKHVRVRPAAVNVSVTPTGVSLDVATRMTGSKLNTTGEPPVRIHLLPEDWRAIAPVLERACGEFQRIETERRSARRAKRQQWREEHLSD